MKSTIRVDYDLDKKEPFIQIVLCGSCEGDLADKTLKAFIEESNLTGIYLSWPSDNSLPQIRLDNRIPYEVPSNVSHT